MSFSCRTMSFVGIVALAVVLAGCGASLKGRWQGTELEPEMARDQFRFLVPEGTPGKLVSADVNLQKDKTFVASVVYGDKVIPVTGTWEWENDTLTMRDAKGESYIYGARKDGDELEIIKGIKGSDVTLKLEKE